jgi:hypothetical protein
MVNESGGGLGNIYTLCHLLFYQPGSAPIKQKAMHVKSIE